MSVPFQPGQFEDPKKSIKGMPVRKVRLDKIDATQVDFDMKKVESMAENGRGGGMLPLVAYDGNGRYKVLDGHHGVAAGILNGDTYAKVRINKK